MSIVTSPIVHQIDDEWSCLIPQISVVPNFLDDYSIVVLRLVDGVYSWMYCGHCKNLDDAENGT
jgi:hypothetical protein